MTFSAEDQKQLQSIGIETSKAVRQLKLLQTGQVQVKLERPCTIQDGIIQLQKNSFQRLIDNFNIAASAGRLQRFVPASGAASRMFSPLKTDTLTMESSRKPTT